MKKVHNRFKLFFLYPREGEMADTLSNFKVASSHPYTWGPNLPAEKYLKIFNL